MILCLYCSNCVIYFYCIYFILLNSFFYYCMENIYKIYSNIMEKYHLQNSILNKAACSLKLKQYFHGLPKNTKKMYPISFMYRYAQKYYYIFRKIKRNSIVFRTEGHAVCFKNNRKIVNITGFH